MVVLMTPAAAKSIQEALQVKESMYTSEIMAGLAQGYQAGSAIPRWYLGGQARQRQAREQANLLGKAIVRERTPTARPDTPTAADSGGK